MGEPFDVPRDADERSIEAARLDSSSSAASTRSKRARERRWIASPDSETII